MRSASPRTFEMVETTRFRARVVAAIETLVDLLDELDLDPDLEPDNDDEPSLGWREARGGNGLCPTFTDEAELGSWIEGARQQHIGRFTAHTEDEEHTAPERYGKGFVDAGPDDDEDSDPGGGDILDIAADQDAVDLLQEELAFHRWMDDTRPARLKAHEATRAQIAKATGRKPGSHWCISTRIQPR
ncbi:hypothetical protein [Xanthobacter sp. YC-JY1]|uniref:hypothetical protein n=1 Tax=Xanthobacter sp. YC-JY1 TaxID=2419844 RepID=UPI001F3E4535|nr:hypothetical protein [Xanthobacter sp. YC-JY1]UJX47179.1 hypothetical protein D7006_22365 [Xanthobacter sp. YC-JY1]